jgi:hypothetical protein
LAKKNSSYNLPEHYVFKNIFAKEAPKKEKKSYYLRGSGSRELAKKDCLYLFPNFQ